MRDLLDSSANIGGAKRGLIGRDPGKIKDLRDLRYFGSDLSAKEAIVNHDFTRDCKDAARNGASS
jgi:hypothetical protein